MTNPSDSSSIIGSNTPAPRRRARVAWIVGIAAVLVVAGILLGPRIAGLLAPPPFPTKAEIDLHRIDAVERNVAARLARRSLLPQQHVAVAIHERMLQEILSSSLPLERHLSNGKYLARLDSAEIRITRGLAEVRLLGRGTQTGKQGFSAEIEVLGALDLNQVKLTDGRIEPEIVMSGIWIRTTEPSGLAALANPVARYFGRKAAADWSQDPIKIPIPMALNEEILLPAVSGSVQLPAARIPLGLRVSAVTPFDHRFVVSIELLPDTTRGGVSADSAGDSAVGIPPDWLDAPGAAAIKASMGQLSLEETTDGLLSGPRVLALRDSVRSLADSDSLWQTLVAQEQDVVVAIPRVVLVELMDRILTRYRVGGVHLDLHDEVSEHVSEEIRVKALFAKVGLGRIDIDLLVHRLQARLRVVERPRITFAPPDSLQVDLQLVGDQGHGIAKFDAKWDPAAVVSVACRGFEVHEILEGTVQPIELPVRAMMNFNLENGRIIGSTFLRRDKMKLEIDLTEASWQRIHAVFEEQNKAFKCGIAMKPEKYVDALKKLGRKGISVKLPKKLPSFSLPATFEGEFVGGGRGVEARVVESNLTLSPEYLRVGVNADLRYLGLVAGDSAAGVDTAGTR